MADTFRHTTSILVCPPHCLKIVNWARYTIAVIHLYLSHGLQIVDILAVFSNPYKINLTAIVRDTSYHLDYKFAGIEVTMAGSLTKSHSKNEAGWDKNSGMKTKQHGTK